MKIIESIEEMREYSRQLKHEGKTIGSVATSGYLHDGHMSLVKIAKENADIVLLTGEHSLFYFNNTPEIYAEHIAEYHANFLENDLTICEKNGVDVFFHPSMLDMYGNTVNKITLSSPIIDRFIQKRASLVWTNRYGDVISMYAYCTLKMINIVSPDVQVIGEKDVYEINSYRKSLLDDLGYSIKLIVAPTIRDSDGMATSSRHLFLTPSKRQDATSIYQTLHEISKWSTYPSIEKIKEHITNRINQANGSILYIDICCPETLEELKSIDRKAVVLVSTQFGNVNLYDQIIIEPQGIK
jgi:pantoate--beta-alanine ligase